jgi:hypothetical protein
LIGDVEIVGGIHDYIIRIPEEGAGGGSAVPNVSFGAVTSHRRDDAARNLPDPVVVLVGDVKVAHRIHGDAAWLIKGGADARSAVPGVFLSSIAGHRRDDAARHPPNPAVILVGDVEVATGIYG